MTYWAYYLGVVVLAYALQYPWLLAGLAVLFVLRRFIPSPAVYLRTLGRIRSLRVEVAANPANVTARRDLASLYLQRLRPRAALRLLDEARARHPDDAELLYLTGLARLRSGDAAGALEPCVRAVAVDKKVRRGEPYRVAAEALLALGRLDEAQDALERYVTFNHSSIEGYTRLALARRKKGDRAGARKALDEALATWSQVPGFLRRRELGWWLRAHLARLYI